MKAKKSLSMFATTLLTILVGAIYLSHPYWKDKFPEISKIIYPKESLHKKSSHKQIPHISKENKHDDNLNFIPKGISQQFCSNNIYNNHYPIVANGFKTSSNFKGIDERSLDKLCYNSYLALYKPDYNISLYVAEKLSVERENKSKNGERESRFYEDPNILKKYGKAIKTEDYTGSGFDRGHLGASRNMPLDDRYESFYMTNIVPQTPENNRNVWAEIEKEARCLVTKYKTDVYTITIPVIDIKKHKAKGSLPILKTKRNDGIVIPDYMAKAIYIPSKNIVGAFITKNDKSKTNYEIISIKVLEELSNIQPFPFLKENQRNNVNLKSIGSCGNNGKGLKQTKII